VTVREVTNEVVSGHELAVRWGLRPQLVREIGRLLFSMEGKAPKERFYLGPAEQQRLKSVLDAIDRI
jgi:hypothetical protein